MNGNRHLKYQALYPTKKVIISHAIEWTPTLIGYRITQWYNKAASTSKQGNVRIYSNNLSSWWCRFAMGGKFGVRVTVTDFKKL